MASTPRASDLAAFHAIYCSPMPAFIPFLVLKYQKADVSPFEDKNSYMMILAFHIATLTYVAAMVTEFKFRISGSECPDFIRNISQLSAPLALISLVTISFPYLGWFLFLIWSGFFVKLSVDTYQEFLSLLGDAARSVSLLFVKLLANDNHDESISAASTSDKCSA